MFTLSYDLSPQIEAKLRKVDQLYKEILTNPISNQTDNQFKWQAMAGHIQGWATLANQPLSRQQIVDILHKLQAKNVSPLVAKVLNYKNAINYVRKIWTANPSPVTFTTVKEISDILGVSPGQGETIEPILSFLQTGTVHPVVQAALVQLSFYPSRAGYLMSYLFLARVGLDLRGWLSLEDCWGQNKPSFIKITTEAQITQKFGPWIDYFCESILIQMQALKAELAHPDPADPQYISKGINTRQLAILDLAEQTEKPLTNRLVQTTFHVSQITASRDLAKLSLAGLLLPQGGGRSTIYTRI